MKRFTIDNQECVVMLVFCLGLLVVYSKCEGELPLYLAPPPYLAN